MADAVGNKAAKDYHFGTPPRTRASSPAASATRTGA